MTPWRRLCTAAPTSCTPVAMITAVSGELLADALRKPQAVMAGHADVAERHAAGALQAPERLRRRCRGRDVVSTRFQPPRHQFADARSHRPRSARGAQESPA